MAPASQQEVAAADTAIREVRRQYQAGWKRVDANTGGLLATSEQRAIRKAYLDVGVLVEKWASQYRRWVVEGKRDDGTGYDVGRFLAYGQGDLADAIQKIAAEAYDRSVFAAVKYAATQTAGQLNPLNWPTGVKLAVGAVVVVALVAAVAVVARR